MSRINIHPLLAFLENYLRGLKIPGDASRIEKENYILALQCVKILRSLYSEKWPVIGTVCKTPAMGRGEAIDVITEFFPHCKTPAMGGRSE